MLFRVQYIIWNGRGSPDWLLFQVFSGASPIHHDKIPPVSGYDLEMMPGVAKEIHALVTAGAEQDQIIGGYAVSWRRHQYEERVLVQGPESLAAKRMPFHHLYPVGQWQRVRAEHVDAGVASFGTAVQREEVMEARGESLVDGNPPGAFQFNDLTKYRKGTAGKRHRFQDSHIVSTAPNRRRRLIPPSGKMFMRTWDMGPTSTTVFSK